MLKYPPAQPASYRTQTTVGVTTNGRPITATVVGAWESPNRVLVLAGQYGDASLAMEVVESLAETWPPLLGRAVAFIACVNPDGRAERRRSNAHGVDLNRDHQRLDSWEIQALHTFARSFEPSLVIDVHTFPPQQKALMEHDLELGADVMLEIDNQPGGLLAYPDRWRDLMIPVLDNLTRQGIRTDRYLVAKASGRVRSSSSDLVDARNGLSARLGATGVLVAGREPSERYGEAGRTRRSIQEAVRAILAQWWGLDVSPPSPLRVVHLDAERIRGPAALAYTLDATDAKPTRRPLPGRSFVELTPARPVRVPVAYGIPKDRVILQAALARHGFFPEEGPAEIETERVATVTSGPASSGSDGAIRHPVLRWHSQTPRFDDHVYYFTDEPGGDRLTAMLEPGSRFGLHRYEDFDIPVKVGQTYAVVRALRAGDATAL